MIASSLAGCMGTDDSTDDSAVAELENEITMQDDKIAELEAEIANLTIENQQALANLAAVQLTLQSTQTSLQSAQANTTMHESVISSLETERDNANAQISILNELMNNMSDQSNETFENMTLQISELNQHISNLSSILNESYVRHQENSTLAASYLSQIQSLNLELQELNQHWIEIIQRLDPQLAEQRILEIHQESGVEGLILGDVYEDYDYGDGFSNEISWEGNSLIYLSNFDFNVTDWDGSEYMIECGGPEFQYDMSCVIFDNSSFHYSIVGEYDGASLNHTDFSFSEGTYLRFRYTNMIHAVFAHSEFQSGWFNNADLTYTDFNNVTFTMFSAPNGYRNDFSNSNLSYSNFNDASLYGLTFANADLTGATFIGTTFVGNNVWSNTICPDGTNSDDNGNTCMNNLLD